MHRQSVVAYLAERRKVLRARYGVLCTGLAPLDPSDPDLVVILAQFSTPRRLLAPLELAVSLSDDLLAHVESGDEQEDVVRYALRPYTLAPKPAPKPIPISTEKPRVIAVHEPTPLVEGSAHVLVAQSDIRHLVKMLKLVKGARRGTPLHLSASRPNVLTFTGRTLGVTIPCQGTWADPLVLSMKHFRDLAPAIPPDDPIAFSTRYGDLVIGDGLTIYRLIR